MELKIEKLIYGGDGLARLADEKAGRAKAVFVPFVAPGEVIEASVVQQKPGFARARVEKILQPSSARVEPPCRYFYRCGGCHYQHLRYEEQLRSKVQILEETLARTAKVKLQQPVRAHASGPLQYRNRTRMRVVHAPEFAIGYFRFGSHQLLPVEHCPISSPLINRALAKMWELGAAGSIDRSVREVQFFANHDDTQLLLELYVERPEDTGHVRPTLEAVSGSLEEIVGAALFAGAPADVAEDQRAPLSAGPSTPGAFFDHRSLIYRTAQYAYQVSAGAFFQVNRFLLDDLIQTVTANRSGELALDLYSGGGFFSLPLAEHFEKVIAVEASPYSFADLKTNAPPNVSPRRIATHDYLLAEGTRLAADFLVVDPPRAGLGEKTSQLLGQMSVPNVTYVSCDPATLSRDMRVLVESGFRVEEVHLFDLFPQTFHLETVVHLVR